MREQNKTSREKTKIKTKKRQHKMNAAKEKQVQKKQGIKIKDPSCFGSLVRASACRMKDPGFISVRGM